MLSLLIQEDYQYFKAILLGHITSGHTGSLFSWILSNWSFERKPESIISLLDTEYSASIYHMLTLSVLWFFCSLRKTIQTFGLFRFVKGAHALTLCDHLIYLFIFRT